MNGETAAELNYARFSRAPTLAIVWEVFMQNRATAFLLQCKFHGKHPRFSISDPLFRFRSLPTIDGDIRASSRPVYPPIDRAIRRTFMRAWNENKN